MNNLERPENVERNNRIRELRGDGISPSSIARRLEISRNIVIGVLNRSGFKTPADELRRLKSAGGTKSGKALKKPVHDPVKAAAGQREFRERKEEPGNGFGAAVGIVGGGCRWPFGDPRGAEFGYCGLPCCQVRSVNGVIYPVSYCSTHWIARRASANTKVVA